MAFSNLLQILLKTRYVKEQGKQDWEGGEVKLPCNLIGSSGVRMIIWSPELWRGDQVCVWHSWASHLIMDCPWGGEACNLVWQNSHWKFSERNLVVSHYQSLLLPTEHLCHEGAIWMVYHCIHYKGQEINWGYKQHYYELSKWIKSSKMQYQ